MGGPPTAQLIFVFLGVGIGAVVPSLLVGIFAIRERSFLVGADLWISASSWYGVGLSFCLVGFILAAFGIVWGAEWTDVIMVLAGGACVLSLEAFVISTGGPILSVFSLYYLYIPVVVGITFPRNLTVLTGVVCWGLCIVALCLTWNPTTWRASAQLMGTRPHSFVYAFLFTVQMVVTIAMIYLGQNSLMLSTHSQ